MWSAISAFLGNVRASSWSSTLVNIATIFTTPILLSQHIHRGIITQYVFIDWSDCICCCKILISNIIIFTLWCISLVSVAAIQGVTGLEGLRSQPVSYLSSGHLPACNKAPNKVDPTFYSLHVPFWIYSIRCHPVGKKSLLRHGFNWSCHEIYSRFFFIENHTECTLFFIACSVVKKKSLFISVIYSSSVSCGSYE